MLPDETSSDIPNFNVDGQVLVPTFTIEVGFQLGRVGVGSKSNGVGKFKGRA